ncbi:phosphotransferase family protein [Paenibacillus sp. CGMCC 1.18879]|nr:aminoglycoside phosphotransferase family protein [Paenibacillus sp. CGMCC 1.18879]
MMERLEQCDLDISALKLLGQGRTASVYAYAEDKVIKLYLPGIPQEGVRREWAASSLAYSLGIRTPRPYECVRIDAATGVVYQHISGITLLGIIFQKPWAVSSSARSLARMHAEIHSREGGELVTQKSVLDYNIGAAPLLTPEEKQRVRLHLDRLPAGSSLCHGDFHPDNVIVNDGCWTIDWMNGMCGHPAGDAARTLVLLSVGSMPENTSRTASVFINLVRRRLKSVYLSQYLKATGMYSTSIDEWLLPVAAARLAEGIPEAEKEQLVMMIRSRLTQDH